MAITNFIAELWSASLVRHLDKRFVYASPFVVNHDYEGEVREYGDTVHLQNVNDVTVGTYTAGSDITDEAPDVSIDTTLVIDQTKYWSVKVDDLYATQVRPNLMDEKTRRAAVAIADTVDQYIAALQSGVVSAGNVVDNGKAGEEKGARAITEAALAYEALVDVSVKLDEQNVPSEGRYAVVPPWFHGLLLKDQRFVSSGSPATDGIRANGHIGEAAGFNLLKSNNVPNTEGKDFRILAGTNQGITFAEQFVKTEAIRMEKQFADKARGLYIYGAKVPNSAELVVLRASKS